VRHALDRWFHVNDDYFDESGAVNNPPVDLTKVNTKNCISGHFGHKGYFIYQRYPKIFRGFRARQRYRAFMFLRDPLTMRCSLYRHQLKVGKTKHHDLATAIMPFNNYYARILHVNENNWKDRIDQYFFVGIADELQQSFDILGKLIGKPHIELPNTNTTQINQATSSEALTAEQVAKFKEENELDYKIFNYAKDRMAELGQGLS
jgi:hypothetical protein